MSSGKELRFLALSRAARGDDKQKKFRRYFCTCSLLIVGLFWYYQPVLTSVFAESAGVAAAAATATDSTAAASASAASAAVAIAAPLPPVVCGDDRCEPPETMANCLADCPGVTTPAMCGEEPHSDPGGYAVVWGASHKKQSATECCDACAAHAADPKNRKRPCNSWVFCHSYPQCWSLDTGNWHGFGECWLKWQADPAHSLYGQRGKFSDEFRQKHRNAHKTGLNPDGTRRNLSVPTHVPWTGGVMGTTLDRSVKWTTGLEGMSSNKGENTVLWRAWETYEQNLARGVKPESMGKGWGVK